MDFANVCRLHNSLEFSDVKLVIHEDPDHDSDEKAIEVNCHKNLLAIASRKFARLLAHANVRSSPEYSPPTPSFQVSTVADSYCSSMRTTALSKLVTTGRPHKKALWLWSDTSTACLLLKAKKKKICGRQNTDPGGKRSATLQMNSAFLIFASLQAPITRDV